jgi:hypothetical protein
VNEESRADGVDAWEDLVLDVGADHRDRGGVRFLARVEEAAGLEIEVEHGVGVGGVAGDLHAPEFAPPRLDERGLLRLSPHRGAGPAVGLDQPAFQHGERLPAIRHEELGAASQDPELGEDQDVGVEIHQILRHELIQSADDRDDRHHGHDADDDAEERQPRAQLVAAQRQQRRAEQLANIHHARIPPTPIPSPSSSPRSSP